MTTPKSLFKYQPFCVQTLTNLLEQYLYFSSPLDFNDPYDCAISTQICGTLTVAEVAKLVQALKSQIDPSPSLLKGIDLLGHDERTKLLIEGATIIFNDGLQKFLTTGGVACFSETNDSLLMWSHYANGGKGVCLEFDTNHNPFLKARRVDYTSEIPVIQARSLLIDDDLDLYVDMFCMKSNHWAYEKEWRSLHMKAHTCFPYATEALKAVYFGSEMKQKHRELVCLILASKYPHVKVFEGIRQPGSFEVQFQQIEYVVNKT